MRAVVNTRARQTGHLSSMGSQSWHTHLCPHGRRAITGGFDKHTTHSGLCLRDSRDGADGSCSACASCVCVRVCVCVSARVRASRGSSTWCESCPLCVSVVQYMRQNRPMYSKRDQYKNDWITLSCTWGQQGVFVRVFFVCIIVCVIVSQVCRCISLLGLNNSFVYLGTAGALVRLAHCVLLWCNICVKKDLCTAKETNTRMMKLIFRVPEGSRGSWASCPRCGVFVWGNWGRRR